MTPRPRDQQHLMSDEYLVSTPLETTKVDYKPIENIVWFNVFWFIGLHIGAFYGLYLSVYQAKWATLFFAFFLYKLSLFGITAGVHRLWSHRAYKAVFGLRVFLVCCNSVAYQNSVFEWARDHRVHHKYTETDADPVNSARGFFFSHCGWLMCKKHPDVKNIGSKVDVSDIISDPVVYFQHKFYIPNVLLFAIFLPTIIPWLAWRESLWTAYWVCVPLRYLLGLHATWFVNSAAHMWGYRPYDTNIAPVENITVSALTLGEGFHNFHHTFPWDYSTSEWGWSINLTTMILDQFAKYGWIYDVKKVSKEMIINRMKRTGNEEVHPNHGKLNGNANGHSNGISNHED